MTALQANSGLKRTYWYVTIILNLWTPQSDYDDDYDEDYTDEELAQAKAWKDDLSTDDSTEGMLEEKVQEMTNKLLKMKVSNIGTELFCGTSVVYLVSTTIYIFHPFYFFEFSNFKLDFWNVRYE